MWFETFLNWQNDLHWGPLESLRPPKDADVGRRLCVRLCALGCLLIVGGIVGVLTLLRWSLFYRYYHQLPSPEGLWQMAGLTVREIGWQAGAASLFFPLLGWPYAVSWNRRAARLRRQTPPGSEDSAPAGVWPPPPVRE